MARVRQRRTAAQWDVLVGEFLASNQSQRTFCERKGLALSSFGRAFRVRARAAQPPPNPLASAFVEIRPSRANPSTITVQVGEDFRIECPADMSVESVARLARAMRDER